jgi:succinate dehydrogenase hydrophobic anchor subunit
MFTLRDYELRFAEVTATTLPYSMSVDFLKSGYIEILGVLLLTWVMIHYKLAAQQIENDLDLELLG